MKLNVDCIRDVLLEIEKTPYGENLGEKALYSALESFSKADIDYSVIKLKEADFINAVICVPDDGIVHKIVIYDITWDGHQFLDKIREPSVWEKIKENGGKAVASISGLLEIISKIDALFS